MKDSAYFRYRILGKDPIYVGAVAEALKAIQSVYRSTLYKNPEFLDSFDERLYIGRVREGSQVYDLITVAAVGVLPLVSDLNATAELFKNLKDLSEYFLRKREAPKKIKAKDCSNVMNFVTPSIQSPEGLAISVGKGNVNIENLTFQLTQEQSQKIHHNAAAEKQKLETPTVEFQQNQILKFIQANAIRTTTQGTNSPDKGIIEDIAMTPHSVVFEEDLMEEKARLLKTNNFYTSSFMVDVEIARSNGKIKAYLLKKITLI